MRVEGSVPSTRHTKVAVAFAAALVSGDFQTAWNLLTPSLQQEFPPQRLQERLDDMFSYFDCGMPNLVHFDDDFVMEDWPEKCPDDLGWVYVSICSRGHVEAVTVIVTEVDTKALIRDITWGRP